MTIRNEYADKLRDSLGYWYENRTIHSILYEKVGNLLTSALAAERRVVGERIRQRIYRGLDATRETNPVGTFDMNDVLAILDEEAA